MVANIILFMPFGFLARLLTGRGVIVAGVAGLATSLIIETSQLTGDWGVFPCAYRAFDTGDLLTNTVGAVAGSLAALLMARRRAPGDPIRVSRLTRRRRVAAMATDVVAAIAIFELTIRVYDALAMTTALFDDGAPTDPSAKAIWGLVDGSSVLFILIACAVHSTAVLVTGTTIGERVLHVRVDSERFRSALLARTIRILAGLGGLMLTALLPDALGRIAAVALILANAVGVFVTKDARGFAQFAAGMHPRVEHPDDPDGL
nr:VanZ family protein [Clavibacter sp. VKM Ac-2873]